MGVKTSNRGLLKQRVKERVLLKKEIWLEIKPRSKASLGKKIFRAFQGRINSPCDGLSESGFHSQSPGPIPQEERKFRNWVPPFRKCSQISGSKREWRESFKSNNPNQFGIGKNQGLGNLGKESRLGINLKVLPVPNSEVKGESWFRLGTSKGSKVKRLSPIPIKNALLVELKLPSRLGSSLALSSSRFFRN